MLIKICFAGKNLPCPFRGKFPHVKCSKLYVYAYIWHSNEGDIPIFYLPLALLTKYMHRRIQALLAMMARVKFNSFQHNLLFLYYFSIHSVPSAWQQARGVLSELGHIHVCKPNNCPSSEASIRKEVLTSVCWSTFLRMKEQFQIHELLEVSKEKAKLLQTELFFMGCTTRALSINPSVQRQG